jgi:hypothetical protein
MSNSMNKNNDIQTETRSSYMTGFGNEFATEVLADSLPKAQNSPQKPPHGLYFWNCIYSPKVSQSTNLDVQTTTVCGERPIHTLSAGAVVPSDTYTTHLSQSLALDANADTRGADRLC